MADAGHAVPPAELATRVGPIALVTIDNGADWQKPNTFGREALESLARCSAGSHARLARPRAHRQAVRLRRRRGHHEFPGITPSSRAQGGRAGHELFGRLRALPFPTLAASTAPRSAAASRSRSTATSARSRASVRHFACPEVFLGLIPGWGGTQLIPRLVGAETAVQLHRRQPAAAEPHAHRAAGVRGRASPTRCSSRSSSSTSRSSCSSAAIEEQAASRDAGRRPRRRRRGLPPRALAGRRRGPRRRAGAVSRARADRGRGHVDDRGGLPRRGGRARRPPARAAGAGLRLRVRPRRAARQARRRRPGREAPPDREGRDRRRRADGDRSSRRSSCAGSRCPSCSRTSTRPDVDAGARLDPRRAAGAGREGPARGGQGALPRRARRRRRRLRRLRGLRPRARGGVRGARRRSRRCSARSRASSRASACSRRTRRRSP